MGLTRGIRIIILCIPFSFGFQTHPKSLISLVADLYSHVGKTSTDDRAEPMQEYQIESKANTNGKRRCNRNVVDDKVFPSNENPVGLRDHDAMRTRATWHIGSRLPHFI